MKKRLLSMLLALCLALALLPGMAWAAGPVERQVYEAMTALKSEYPEGMRWTNDNFYAWNGGIYSGGAGCAGFAFMLSDAAFGELPARMLTTFEFSDVRVGDILRINNDTHSVIVLEVNDSGVVIAEGNFNRSVHWGRTLTKDQVLAATYMMTRYPLEDTPPADITEPETPADLAYPSTQIVDLNGTEVEFQMYALKDANGNDTNHIKIRDLALALNGTSAAFNIGWANGVSAITTGVAYKPNGSENKTPFSGQRPYTKSAISFILNGSPIELESIGLTDDAGGGYTYCQVKDLAAKLNFTARWDAARQIIRIETE